MNAQVSASPCFRSLRSRKSVRRADGFTLIEMLMAGFILSILMIGLGTIFLVHWQSYYHVYWQNKVDQEARQALDQICDDIRYTSAQGDEFSGNNGNNGYMSGGTPITLSAYDPAQQSYSYAVMTEMNGPDKGISTLVRTENNNVAIAHYITNISFEYEYRGGANGPGTWNFYRTTNPNNGSTDDPNGYAFKRVTTIYVTVTASTQGAPDVYSSGAGDVYSRTLVAAVHLRQPINYGVTRAVE